MSESTNATHYDVLGVQRSVDQATIRKAYLKTSLRCHPDKNLGRAEEAKAEFVKVGQAYEVLKDPTKRATYDRELSSGRFRFRPKPQQQQQQQQTTGTASSNQQHADYGYGTSHASSQQQVPNYNNNQSDETEEAFNKFANMFDETVGGMSEEELNAAMGAASMVGGIIGSILASHAARGSGSGNGSTNSFLQAAASMAGSAIASRAAGELVKTVHEDSAQRVLERRERQAAIARGESVPMQPSAGESNQRRFQEAGKAFQKVAGAAMGGGGSSSSNTNQNQSNKSSFMRNRAAGDPSFPGNRGRNSFHGNRSTSNDTSATKNNNSEGDAGFDWAQAAKIATAVFGACAEMKSSRDDKKNERQH